VGLYTSPHLKKFNERIQINGHQIPDDYIASFFKDNRKIIKSIEATFFETTTAMALDYFRKESVDYAIIETGLGGRLDSTNVISPIVCGISSISMDHTDILGDTIEKIATEKAGIIKNNIPILTFEHQDKVLRILSQVSKEKKSPLNIVRDEDINIIRSDKHGTLFSYLNFKINLPLIGRHQVKNCSLAIALSQTVLGESLDILKIKSAVFKTKWKGRLEILNKSKNLFYDVGHNYEGIAAMIESISALHPDKKLIGLFSIKSNKNLDKICELIKENFEKIIICSDKNGYLMRSSDLQKIFNKNNSNVMSVSSVKRGIELLKNYDNNHITIIFGSHYIAEEVYSSVGKYFDTTNN
jgi:dihydrofolate synthase/folylpolyglutamate synthase